VSGMGTAGQFRCHRPRCSPNSWPSTTRRCSPPVPRWSPSAGPPRFTAGWRTARWSSDSVARSPRQGRSGGRCGPGPRCGQPRAFT
jgi:hypothetical protein